MHASPAPLLDRCLAASRGAAPVALPRRRAVRWREPGRCVIDGGDLLAHLDCPLCGILIGPGHLEPALVRGLCGYCARREGRRHAAA